MATEALSPQSAQKTPQRAAQGLWRGCWRSYWPSGHLPSRLRPQKAVSGRPIVRFRCFRRQCGLWRSQRGQAGSLGARRAA
jgi:hypothetical protein